MNFTKKYENSNSNERIAKKMANFGQFLAIMGKMGIFFKKALGTFFSRLQALTNCKVSVKSNDRISSSRVTHGRTRGRMHERTRVLRSPTTSSRDQKIRKFQCAVLEKTWQTETDRETDRERLDSI